MSGRTPCWPAVICAGSVRGAGIHRVVGDDEPAAGSGDRVPVRGAGPIVVSSRRRRTGGGRPAAGAAAAAAETDSRMTTAPAPLLATLPRRRPRRRAPAERTTVVPLEGDLEARPASSRPTSACGSAATPRSCSTCAGATFLGAGAARLLLDLRSQAAASSVRLVLWRPEGQPFRTLRIVRFDRVFELRPASWRPPRSRDRTVAQPERWVDVRAG